MCFCISRTPEILNSLIAMTNPLDNYSFGEDAPKLTTPSGATHTRTGPISSTSNDSNSSSCSQAESPTTSNTPPSIQETRRQLIRAGLKLSIEQKRKHNSESSEDLLDLDHCKRMKKSESESEDRRNDHGVSMIMPRCINYGNVNSHLKLLSHTVLDIPKKCR